MSDANPGELKRARLSLPEYLRHHFTDTLDFKEDHITDRELIVEFYSDENELLKWESVLILTTKNKLKLPSIQISVNATDLSKVKELETEFTILNDSPFTLDSNFKHLYVHHEGWEPGEHRARNIDTDKKEVSFTDTYTFSDECIVLNVGAGLDVRYGKFVKRIYNQQLLYRGDWADPVKVNQNRVNVASDK